MKLVEQINYQTGSIVSQEISRKKVGTVTLFAFDKAQGLSEHTAPFDALVYILEGIADINIDGKVQRSEAGELVTMPANTPHALTAVTAFKMLLVMIRSNE